MNCSELRTKLAEIKTLKEDLVSGLTKAQNHEDTLILVNLKEKIEKKLENLEEILPINIDRLEEKHGEGETLSKRELWFIYELDKLFNRKTRVKGEDIEERRKQMEEEREATRRQDLAKALDCREEQISLTQEEALSGDIKYHDGLIVLTGVLTGLKSAKDLKLPELIGGSLDLSGFTSVEGLKLPKFISAYLDLRNLTSAKGLELSGEIGGSIFLNNLPPEEKEELKRKYPHLVSKII